MTQSGMPNPVELYQAAVNRAKPVIAGVKTSQLSDTTPCEKWNVQDLLDHLAGGPAFTLGLLTASQPGSAPEHPGAEDFQAHATKVAEVAKAPGALEREIDTPFGRMPGAALMMGAFMDTLVHTWDLAKATSQNTAMDPHLAEACYAAFAPQMGGLRGGDNFGTEVKVPENASTQDKLLGVMGRQP